MSADIFSSEQAVEIRGTASGANFQDYRIEYLNKDGKWIQVGAISTVPLEDGLLGNVDLSKIYSDINADDNIIIRLVVRSRGLLEYMDMVSIEINDASISYPDYIVQNGCAYSPICSGVIEITGTAAGIGFDSYQVKLTDLYSSSEIDVSPKIYAPVHDGVLFRWDTSGIK